MNPVNKTLNWKHIVWLSLICYGLYLILWFAIDRRILQDEALSPRGFLLEMALDFVLCLLFIAFSLCYNRLIFKILPMRRMPYPRLLFFACILFLLNNGMAYLMTGAYNLIWGDTGDELFRQQSIYTYGMIATFVSCIYYLEIYMKTRDEKQALAADLAKEKEVALQSQLDALKSQIDSHFMFNNFSILAELIEEDRVLAGQFLANLSKVYRYIIQNMKRHQIPIAEEIAFLDAYLYLIEMRYGATVAVHIDPAVREADGYIPPTCLQLLVENAIKHNRHTADQPLHIDIRRENDRLSVSHPLAPLRSPAEPSTGIGQKNLAERYALLGNRQLNIRRTEAEYTVELPILEAQTA